MSSSSVDCTLGAGIELLRRHNFDLKRSVVGPDWGLCVTRYCVLDGRAYPDRSSVQVRGDSVGWRTLLDELSPYSFVEQKAELADYWEQICDTAQGGGGLLLLDEESLPWIPYARLGHGSAPHIVALLPQVPRDRINLYEGLSAWPGVRSLSRAELEAAAFPIENPHRIEGDFWALGYRPEFDTSSIHVKNHLLDSLRVYLSDDVDPPVQKRSPISVVSGKAAATAGREALIDFGYLVGQPTSVNQVVIKQEAALIGFTLERLSDDLMGVAEQRTGAADVLTLLGVPDELSANVGNLAGLWRLAARELRRATQNRTSIQSVVQRWDEATSSDRAVAQLVYRAIL